MNITVELIECELNKSGGKDMINNDKIEYGCGEHKIKSVENIKWVYRETNSSIIHKIEKYADRDDKDLQKTNSVGHDNYFEIGYIDDCSEDYHASCPELISSALALDKGVFL